MRWPWQRNPETATETRASASGFAAEILAARESYISGRRRIGELTATVQTCVSHWENGFVLSDVSGTDLLTGHVLALAARSAALRGEAVFLITERGLIPAADWDLRTRDSVPTAYRLSISEAGGGRSITALAGEVLHLRIGCDVAAPYYGQAPLRRASLTAGMLQAIETALAETFENMPLGSQIVPFPEARTEEMTRLGDSLRGKRGRVLLRESVQVTGAGGPTPATDWRSSDVSPDLSRSMTDQTLSAARNAILAVYGILPAMFSPNAMGPLVREAQRHLAQWQLQPMAALLAEEATAKLGTAVTIDTMRPLQAYDAGGRARALSAIIGALAEAKEAGIDPNAAMKLVDWQKT